jgi:hypothetical protein
MRSYLIRLTKEIPKPAAPYLLHNSPLMKGEWKMDKKIADFFELVQTLIGSWLGVPERLFHTLYYGEHGEEQHDMAVALKRLWELVEYGDNVHMEFVPWGTWRLYAAMKNMRHRLQYMMTDELQAVIDQVMKDLLARVCRGMYPEDYLDRYWTEWEYCLIHARGREHEWIQARYIDPSSAPVSIAEHLT